MTIIFLNFSKADGFYFRKILLLNRKSILPKQDVLKEMDEERNHLIFSANIMFQKRKYAWDLHGFIIIVRKTDFMMSYKVNFNKL